MTYEYLRRFEGDVRHLYKDTQGIITAGVGFALRSLAEAQALPNWDHPRDVELDWAAVQQAPAGKLPSFYRSITRARLIDVDAELLRRVGKLPYWALSLPDPARDALTDIQYNTGNVDIKHWPRLVAACQRGDWRAAAAESHRPDVGKARNDWTHDQFMACLERTW